MKQIQKHIKILLSAAIVVGGIFMIPQHVSAAPAHFVVDDTGDGFDALDGDGICGTLGGVCTLRAAVSEANSNGNPADVDLITFNIPPLDGNVKTIVQDGDAPYSFREPVIVDGYTQDDAAPNTNPAPQPLDGKLLIEIDGSASTYGAAFNVIGPDVTIKGLVMNRYKSSPVHMLTADATDVNIQGNYFETDATGMTQMTGVVDPYAPAIAIDGGASDILIGGPNPEDRNVLTHTASGIIVDDASDIAIQGNNIMVASDGVTPLSTTNDDGQSGITLLNASDVTIGGNSSGESNDIENITTGPGIAINNGTSNVTVAGNRIVGNFKGIELYASSNITIGGSVAASNLISGNFGTGVTVGADSSAVKIQSNKIGVADDGVTALSNNGDGIDISDSSVLVGGSLTSQSNTIAHNVNKGVNVTSGSGASSIIGNKITSNGALGIDLANNGVSSNDILDPDTGPNTLLNYPRVYQPEVSGGNTDLTYSLDVPAGDYRIEFYSNTTPDSTNYGEGETLIGTQNVTSSGSGLQEFTTTVAGNSHANVYATATVIDVSAFGGFGPTSEFGNRGVPVTDVGITKTLDNPEDLAIGANLSYSFEYTNHGISSLDLTNLDGSGDIFSSSLFFDYLPPDLMPTNLNLNTGEVATSSPDVTCAWAGPGSVGMYFGAQFANHTDYSFMYCWYTGSDTDLVSDDSLAITIDFTVMGSTDFAFTNYVVATPPSASDDPDEANLNAAGGFPDTIDAILANYPNLNNFSRAQLSTDIGVTAELVNPEDVSPGNTVYYDVHLNNRGLAGIDLADYSSVEVALLYGLYPAEDLTFVNSTTAGISCTDFGPGSAAYFANATATQDHSTHQMMYCVHDNTSDLLLPGETFTFRLAMTVDDPVSDKFDFYAFGISSVLGDPDLPSLGADFSSASSDVLDTITNDNYVRVAYDSNPGGGPTPQPETDNNGSNPKDTTSDDLSSTGENVQAIAIIAGLIVLAGGLLFILTMLAKKRRTEK